MLLLHQSIAPRENVSSKQTNETSAEITRKIFTVCFCFEKTNIKRERQELSWLVHYNFHCFAEN